MSKKRRRLPKIKFQFTENRKKDILRFIVAGVFFLSLITAYWNRGDTPLKNIEQGYQGFVLAGTYQQKMLSEEGVALIKSWLEERTAPAINPLTILTHHRRSNNPTKHYELIIGMTPLTEEGIREYAIYQAGEVIYLRVEPLGIDRVLKTSFTAGELESALKPYIGGEFRSTNTAF